MGLGRGSLWIGLVLSACGGEVVMAPLHRFADDAAERGPALTEALRDDTRRVLREHPRQLLFNARISVAEDRRWKLSLPVPASLQGAGHLVLQISHAQGKSWRRLETQSGEIVDGRIERTLELPQGDYALRIVARAPPPRVLSQDTAALPIPPAAELDYAIGLVDVGLDAGDVGFRVSVCPVGDDCTPLHEEQLASSSGDVGRWHDRRHSLERWAGRSVRFRFESSRRSQAPDAFAFPVWANPAVWAPRPRDDEPNLVIVSFDTLGARHLPTWGYARDTAPFLDALVARRGTVFENAITAASTTGPSHMTMFTSLQPGVHGVHGNLFRTRLPDRAILLAEVLRERGFATAAVTEDGPLAVDRGFGRGFDSYAENKGAGVFQTAGFIEETLRAGRRFIERNRDRRFFLFLHSFQVHSPYNPPARYAGHFQEPLPGERIRASS